MNDELKIRLEQHKMWLLDNRYNTAKLSRLCNGLVWVTRKGVVFSVLNSAGTIRKTPFKLKNRVGVNRYLSVSIKGKNVSVHRIVADAFIGDITNKVVHHINSRRDDNRVENLEITDHSTNNRYSSDNKNKKKADIKNRLITEMIRYYRK